MNEDLNILVVDDEQPILDLFKRYFETSSKYTLFSSNDGLEALEIIKNKEIDCCFTDLCMPRLDGLELAHRIHFYDNTIPVVVMTAYPSLDNAIETLKNGVSDFLTKPFKMDQIIPTINRVMASRSLLVDNIILKEEANKSKELLEINHELQHKIKEVETVNLILHQLDQATTSKDLFKILVNLSGNVTACDEAHFCFFTEEMKDHVIVASYFRNEENKAAGNGCIDKNIIKKVADDGVPCLVRGNKGDNSTMSIPLKIRSRVFGILISIIKGGKHYFNEKELYYLNFLAEKASFLIENLALYENIYQNLFSTLYAFVETIEARDPYTKQHSTTVSSYAMSIARANGCSQEEIAKLNIAGNLHDIAKIGIPDDVPLKPGRLTDESMK